ncbi:gluconate 2-dehydrogenase subunit 3 family protein [Exilibacterium tricleocarpae]|uniref:Gluconate 2-dehydrogenase subunit 3 family protein n=1 Tax=Exilibacterium tricleocarpae TaxID=2591008 RepID=A0A545SP42_9GAMM|nr:gluconate 2-dehydrogenase subunit 3 family protein [Exilibacterium tricleocarpae]TQV66717.1 gluconate 2-dehydrogenase subunit 3 family protein [Exilibacterium tricleocarpae]
MADKITDKPVQLDRRGALKIIATTAAAVPVLGCAPDSSTAAVGAVTPRPESELPVSPPSQPRRTPFDPDLLNPDIHWDLVLTGAELTTLKALANVIIPADAVSPGAGDLDAQDFINEWVSAPYQNNKRDLILVRGGLVWLQSEAGRRYGRRFTELSPAQVTAICDDIKWRQSAQPAYQSAAIFFEKVRDLTATAFYTTEEGMADIGYLGNKALASFEGPPLAVLRQLGLEQYADQGG